MIFRDLTDTYWVLSLGPLRVWFAWGDGGWRHRPYAANRYGHLYAGAGPFRGSWQRRKAGR